MGQRFRYESLLSFYDKYRAFDEFGNITKSCKVDDGGVAYEEPRSITRDPPLYASNSDRKSPLPFDSRTGIVEVLKTFSS